MGDVGYKNRILVKLYTHPPHLFNYILTKILIFTLHVVFESKYSAHPLVLSSIAHR